MNILRAAVHSIIIHSLVRNSGPSACDSKKLIDPFSSIALGLVLSLLFSAIAFSAILATVDCVSSYAFHAVQISEGG